MDTGSCVPDIFNTPRIVQEGLGIPCSVVTDSMWMPEGRSDSGKYSCIRIH